jgi:hypothetical protein
MGNDREADGRFRKGVCPNPKGRPRKDKTVSSAILTAAQATVTATENGKRRKIRKLDATAAQIANKGASGDIRAGKLFLDLAVRAEAEQRSTGPIEMSLTPSDQEIAERFLAEYRRHIEDSRQ